MGRKWYASWKLSGIIPLKKADAEIIYLAIVKCLKEKNLQISNIGGMGFDNASTFSGKKTDVQARLKKHSPHDLFVHCHCHMLQLACVYKLPIAHLE